MHVALVVQSTAFGGAEQYAASLLRHLPRAVRRTLVTTPAAPDRLTRVARSAAELVLVPADGTGRALSPPLRDALRRLGPDVAHVNCVNAQHDRDALDVAAQVAPAVATLHLPLPLWGVPCLPALRRSWQRLARCIVVSQPGRALLVDGLGVEARNVAVVRNGVEVDGEVPDRPSPEPGTPDLLTVARLDRQKGIDILLEAVERLPVAHRPRSVTVLGEGPGRRVLEQRAQPLLAAGVPVRLPGPSADVPAAFAAAGLFCLPSREEGLPLALLEAMAAGLPCVATDVGDVADAVGDSAVVVPAADPSALAQALSRLVVDAGARHRLGAAARRRAVACFDVRTTARATAAVYADALLGDRPRRDEVFGSGDVGQAGQDLPPDLEGAAS